MIIDKTFARLFNTKLTSAGPIPYWTCLAWVSFIYLFLLIYKSKLDMMSLATGDINQYILMANEIAGAGLKSGSFTHGPLYPALGSLFIKAGITANPFPLISVGLVSSSISWLIHETSKLKLARGTYLLAGIAIVILTDPATKFIIEGASNAITASAIFSLVALALSSQINALKIAFCAVLLGLCFGTRYVDVLLLSPLIICCLTRVKGSLSGRMNNRYQISLALMSGAAIIAASLTSTLYIQHSVLGSWKTTPYDSKIPAIARIKESNATESPASQLSSRDFTKIIPRSYQVLIDQSPYIHEYERFEQQTLLERMPYLCLLPTGIYLLWKRRGELRSPLTSLSLSFLIWICFYSTGWAFTSHDIYFGCLRYVAGWSLLMGMIGLYGISLKKKWQIFPSILTAALITISGYAYKIWDKATESLATFELDSNQTVYDSHRDYSNKSDRNHLRTPQGLQYSKSILINSTKPKSRFIRVELETPSSLDNYFPKSVSLSSRRTNVSNVSLSRENHTWVIKLQEPVDSLEILINNPHHLDLKPFELFSVSTYRL